MNRRNNLSRKPVYGGSINPFAPLQKLSLALNPNQTIYEGEWHPISTKDASIYQFLGAGTKVEQRLKNGDKPINDVDKVAKSHDVSYYNAGKALKSKKINNAEFLGKIKTADIKFREDIKKTKDDPIIAAISEKLIHGKDIAETVGLLSTKTFSGGKLQKKQDPLLRLKEEAKLMKKGNKLI